MWFSQVYACREEKGVLTGVRGARLHVVHTRNSDGRTSTTYKVTASFQLDRSSCQQPLMCVVCYRSGGYLSLWWGVLLDKGVG
jgi:hypothetical protein